MNENVSIFMVSQITHVKYELYDTSMQFLFLIRFNMNIMDAFSCVAFGFGLIFVFPFSFHSRYGSVIEFVHLLAFSWIGRVLRKTDEEEVEASGPKDSLEFVRCLML